MARPALLPVALVVLVALAGCGGVLPGSNTTTPADVDAEIVNTMSTGGQCVADPMRDLEIVSRDSAGIRVVNVSGNVTVPGANYVLNDTSLTKTGDGAYRLDLNTTEDTEKPEKSCENGGIVHYEVVIQVPATQSFELVIRHDGRAVSAVGSGSSSESDSGGSGGGAGAGGGSGDGGSDAGGGSAGGGGA